LHERRRGIAIGSKWVIHPGAIVGPSITNLGSAVLHEMRKREPSENVDECVFGSVESDTRLHRRLITANTLSQTVEMILEMEIYCQHRISQG
jgi:hypothetical protein